MNGPSSERPAGRGPFVAAFGSGAAGDVSPNTYGSWCQDVDVNKDIKTGIYT